MSRGLGRRTRGCWWSRGCWWTRGCAGFTGDGRARRRGRCGTAIAHAHRLLRSLLALIRQTVLVLLQALQNSAAARLNVGTEPLRVARAAGLQYRKGRIVLRPCQGGGLYNAKEKQQRQSVHFSTSPSDSSR